MATLAKQRQIRSGTMRMAAHSSCISVQQVFCPDHQAARQALLRCGWEVRSCAVQAVCVEAGMLALRRDATEVNHEDFNEGIIAVQAKKKTNLNYYA